MPRVPVESQNAKELLEVLKAKIKAPVAASPGLVTIFLCDLCG